MKSQIKFSFIVIVIGIFCKCNNNKINEADKKGESDSYKLGSYEIMPNGDTVNFMDSKNRKQGLWYETDLDNNPYTKKIDTIYYENGVALKQP